MPVIAAVPSSDGVQAIRLAQGAPGDPQSSMTAHRIDAITGPREFDGVWWEFQQVGSPPCTPE